VILHLTTLTAYSEKHSLDSFSCTASLCSFNSVGLFIFFNIICQSVRQLIINVDYIANVIYGGFYRNYQNLLLVAVNCVKENIH